MPRYLTPAKLCLLLLVDLYAEDEIPSSAKLDVLSFIASQVNPPSDHDQASIEERFSVASSGIAIFSDKLSPYPSGVPGRSLHDALLQRIWRLHDLDSVHNLFHQLGGLVTPSESGGQQPLPPKVSRSSPLGQFIRRCCVEFTRLQFADSQALWNAFATYRAPSYPVWSSRNPEAARELSHSQPPWAKPLPLADAQPSNYTSTEDTDTLLSFSIYQLQKLGTRLPSSTKQSLQTWISDQWDSSAQSLQHFLAFFEHWRSGQYTIALESLHRYFDYSLVASSTGDAGGGNVKVYYQYALLHLSVLHADFEAWEESVDAMDECIATARENQDVGCLNFALSWLLYLRQAHPDEKTGSFGNLARLVGGGNSESDALAFLKSKARDGRGWSLLSSTLLEEAKGEMYAGGSSSKAFEHILQASYLNVQHDLRTLMPAATLFHGTSYDRLGQSSLSTQIYQSIKSLHGTHCPLNDRIRSSCRAAYNLAQSGQYTAAIHLLDSITPEAKGVLKLEQRIQAFQILVQLRTNIRRNNTQASTTLLHDLAPLRNSSDPEITFETTLLELDLDLKQQAYLPALNLVNTTLTTLKQKSSSADLALHLHLLVLKAKIFAAGNQATKGFSIALRAAAMAERHLLFSVLTEALGVLGGILNELSEFEAAREVVEAALPRALEGRDPEVVGRLFMHLATAYVGIAGTFTTDWERETGLRRAVEAVDRGTRVFEGIEEVEGLLGCLVMKRRLAECRGEEDAVRKAEERYDEVLMESMRGDIA